MFKRQVRYKRRIDLLDDYFKTEFYVGLGGLKVVRNPYSRMGKVIQICQSTLVRISHNILPSSVTTAPQLKYIVPAIGISASLTSTPVVHCCSRPQLACGRLSRMCVYRRNVTVSDPTASLRFIIGNNRIRVWNCEERTFLMSIVM